MRSSRSAADPLAPGPGGFAHRGLHRAPAIVENTLAAFAAALVAGAGIECDLRLTADDHLLVFHDRDAQRLCGDPAIIGRSDYADLAHLSVGGHPIATLAQLLALVAGRVPILLEAKVDGDLWRFGPALMNALANYSGPFGVMSFDPRMARWLRTNARSSPAGWSSGIACRPPRRWIAMTLADPQFLAVEVAALGKPWVAAARAHMPVYSWTVRTSDQRRLAAANADAPIWEADGRP